MSVPISVDALPAVLEAALASIGGFEPSPRLAVGVSGGADSLALVILADRWVRARNGQVVGLIVDHGLRAESAREAARVAEWLGARGIAHAVLQWQGRRPHSGIQEAARNARYDLLSGWCRGNGCLHLLAAHHRDDQIETHRIRARARSGPDGLAGMSAVSRLDGCRLVRPLLEVGKSCLVALLRREEQPFLCDPSNLDPSFERGRLRRGEEPGAPAELAGTIRALGTARAVREVALVELLAGAVALHPGGFAVLSPSSLSGQPPETVERLLSRLVSTIGVGAYPVRGARVACRRRLMTDPSSRPATLGGCRIVPWRGRLLVVREVGRAAAPMDLAPGTQVLWDRRFLASVDAGSSPMTLGYLDDRVRDLPRVVRGKSLPPPVQRALPAFWDDAGISAVPHLGYFRDDESSTNRVIFHPRSGLAPAGFTVV